MKKFDWNLDFYSFEEVEQIQPSIYNKCNELLEKLRSEQFKKSRDLVREKNIKKVIP